MTLCHFTHFCHYKINPTELKNCLGNGENCLKKFPDKLKALVLKIDFETVKIDLRGLKTVFVVSRHTVQINYKTLVLKID